jgi:hypothetical protein
MEGIFVGVVSSVNLKGNLQIILILLLPFLFLISLSVTLKENL